MAASAGSSLLESGEVEKKNNKMSNHSSSVGGPQLTSVPCSSATFTFCTPTVSLLDRKVAGAPSATGLFQRRHSVSIPSAKFTQNQFDSGLKTESSAALGSGSSSSNKENRFRGRSYSELGDRPHPSSHVSAGGSGQANLSRYKTELCRPFEENGTCKYGDKCQFAHGMHELRSLSRHPKYKTELCRTFHTIGFCPYGPRCHFIHNAEECRGPPPLSSFNKKERPRLQHSISFAGFPSSVGPQDNPTSLTPPSMFSLDDLTTGHSNPLTFSTQEHASMFGPSFSSWSEPQFPPPPSPITACLLQPSLDSPQSPEDSLFDQEGYQSSVGSQSGSESPVLDSSHRLPIFSTLSITDD